MATRKKTKKKKTGTARKATSGETGGARKKGKTGGARKKGKTGGARKKTARKRASAAKPAATPVPADPIRAALARRRQSLLTR